MILMMRRMRFRYSFITLITGLGQGKGPVQGRRFTHDSLSFMKCEKRRAKSLQTTPIYIASPGSMAPTTGTLDEYTLLGKYNPW